MSDGGATADTSAWDPNMLPPTSPNDELVLLATDSMRARRRPLAILTLWAWQAALATVVAWPAAAAVSAYYGTHPSGDAPLWQPGGLPLLEMLLDARSARRETIALAGIVFLVAGLADLLPLGGLLASMAYVTRDKRSPRLRALLRRGAAAFPTFALLFAMASMAEGLLVGSALTIAFPFGDEAIVVKLGDARADQVAWLAALAILGVAAIVGVLHDLARAAAVRFRVKALRSWRLAFNALARSPASVLWSWVWRGLAGWAPIVLGALVAARLGGRGGGALVALFLVHQLVLVVRVALRASWLAKALRAVDRAHRVIGRGRRSKRREASEASEARR
jgi:hypothetical protein